MYYAATFRTGCGKGGWLKVVLQTGKPENEYGEFSLYLGPRCAGNRNPDS